MKRRQIILRLKELSRARRQALDYIAKKLEKEIAHGDRVRGRPEKRSGG